MVGKGRGSMQSYRPATNQGGTDGTDKGGSRVDFARPHDRGGQMPRQQEGLPAGESPLQAYDRQSTLHAPPEERPSYPQASGDRPPRAGESYAGRWGTESSPSTATRGGAISRGLEPDLQSRSVFVRPRPPRNSSAGPLLRGGDEVGRPAMNSAPRHQTVRIGLRSDPHGRIGSGKPV